MRTSTCSIKRNKRIILTTSRYYLQYYRQGILAIRALDFVRDIILFRCIHAWCLASCVCWSEDEFWIQEIPNTFGVMTLDRASLFFPLVFQAVSIGFRLLSMYLARPTKPNSCILFESITALPVHIYILS